jgi:hypothetical protein
MKLLCSVTIAFVSVVFLFGCDIADPSSPNQAAVGTWEGRLPDTTATLIFTEDGTVEGSYIEEMAVFFALFGTDVDVSGSYSADEISVDFSFEGQSSEPLTVPYTIVNDTLQVTTSSGGVDKFRRRN